MKKILPVKQDFKYDDEYNYPPHCNLNDAACVLGVSVREMRRLKMSGEVPCFRRWHGEEVFLCDSLDEWLESHRSDCRRSKVARVVDEKLMEVGR